MNRKEWLAERRKGIGGSDAPVVLGVSPFKTRQELWAEKRGLIADTEPTTAMKRGTYLEPIVGEMYVEATGRTRLIPRKMERHETIPFLTANVDAFLSKKKHATDTFDGVLEIKCPGLSVFGKCQREGLPDYYHIQGQHYLAVTRLEWGSFAVFSAERWRLEVIDFERDENLIAMIIEECGKFWEHVQNGTVPDEEPTVDLKLPDVGDQQVMKLTDAPELMAVRAYEDAKAIEIEAKALTDDAKQRLRSIMGPFAVSEGGGWRFYNRQKPGRKTVDHERLFVDYPDIDRKKYEKQGKAFDEFRAYSLRGDGE